MPTTAPAPALQMHLDMLQNFESIYVGMLAMGFFYGLTLCNLSCIPLIGPYIIGTQRGFRRGFDATAVFVITRVATYTLLGGLSGLIGNVALKSFDSGVLFAVAGSLVLLISAVVIFKPKSAACSKNNGQVQGPVQRSWVHMVALGISTSLVPCLPLTAVLFYAATTQSFFTGCLLALMFGIGTSASPLYYIGGAAGWFSDRIRNEIPRYTSMLRTISGVILALFGVRLLVMSGLIG
jgi:cytochrome c-type biogenesis protein